MFENQFKLTLKQGRGYQYVYIQRVVYAGKNRKIESFSLGTVENIAKIITTIQESNESLFFGEVLLYCFTQNEKYNQLLETILQPCLLSKKENMMLHWLINTRILVPSSKQRVLRHFSHSAFSELMPSPESNAIYELMDKFKTPEAYFETYVQQVLSKLKYTPEWHHFDTTTIYFYSDYDELRTRGFGKDGRKGSPLIKLALSCTEDLIPVMYKVYPGRESDQTAFQEFIEKIKFRPDLKQKIITFDAGCYSFKKVKQLETEGFNYVCMADISTHSLEGTPQEYIIDDDNWVLQPGSYKGRRVLEAYNDTHHLAAIEKLSRKMGLVTQFIESVVGRTPDTKLKKVQELINGLGLKRLLEITLSDNNLVLTVHEEQVQTQKDKLKKLVLMTNLPETTSDTTLIQYYLKRSSIEQVYRYIKSPFEIRPVYHWKQRRIHSHVFLVLLGYFHLTILRYYLSFRYSTSFTLEKLLEDLTYTTIIRSEPRSGKYLLHLGKQPTWIVNVVKKWNINLQQDSSISQMSITE
jgi:hypothetical protein